MIAKHFNIEKVIRELLSYSGPIRFLNHHLTHLPADGSVYFTDTRGYHTVINGGEVTRTHIVAALANEQIKS